MAGRKKRKESGTDETEADLNGNLKEAVDGEDPSSKSRVQRRRLDPAQVEVLEAHFQKDIYPSASSKVNSRDLILNLDGLMRQLYIFTLLS